jgi:hypothetical protein
MNQYATQARAHWQRFLPHRYSQIPDPDRYFTTLGQEVEQEIADLTETLAGDDPPGEDFLAKTGRINAAAQQAREKVLAERVLLPAEPGSEMDETEPTELISPTGDASKESDVQPLAQTVPQPPPSTVRDTPDDELLPQPTMRTGWISTVENPDETFWTDNQDS